jgi:hypothetical protein
MMINNTNNTNNINHLCQLPTEVIIRIVIAARSSFGPLPDDMAPPHPDVQLLSSLRLTCWQLCRALDANRDTIIAAFTVYSVSDTEVVIHIYDGPRLVVPTDVKITYHFCGRLHRRDDPAYSTINSNEWYRFGRRHRGGDLPAIMRSDGLEWWVNGVRHRDEDLPAVYKHTGWVWYKNGKKHRADGPASVYPTIPFDAIFSRAKWSGYDDPIAWYSNDTTRPITADEYDWTLPALIADESNSDDDELWEEDDGTAWAHMVEVGYAFCRLKWYHDGVCVRRDAI